MAFDRNHGSEPGEENFPSLEDFLSFDPAHLPFLQERSRPSEDSLRYQIFADDWISIEHLRQLRESILGLVDSMTSCFIWHRESFELSVAVPAEGDLEPHLHGHQTVGDSVSDEWFVCYLLFTITSTFDGLTARITDDDGEFLLIEAAIAIPPFLSPANSNHRVWIRSGEVHLVMPGCIVNRERTPRTLWSGPITLSEGVTAVREGDGVTLADERVQRLIQRRIEGYPDKADSETHRARCFLPVVAALAFRDSPGLVATAVHAYCYGDPENKRQGARMSCLLSASIPLSGKREADSVKAPRARFVETRIIFTRHLYAQLHHAAVVPSKAILQNWVPSDSSLSHVANAKAAQLGQKLSMGLEAAYQESAERCSRRAKGDLTNDVTSHAWLKFMDALERNGFFEGEMKGSKRYREKVAMAQQFAREKVFLVDEDGGGGESGAFRRRAVGVGGTVQEVIDRAIQKARDGGYIFHPSSEEDKEDWLEVSEAGLTEMMKSYLHLGNESETSDRDAGGDARRDSSTSSPKPENGDDVILDRSTFKEATAVTRDDLTGLEDTANELDDIVTGMTTFIDDSKAGPEGVEVDTIAGEVRFDVDKFMRLLNGEDLTSALDEEGGEDTLADLHGGEYDFILQSSEEEDKEEHLDKTTTTERITEPGSREVVGLKDVTVDPNDVSNDAHEPETLNKGGSEPRHKVDRNSQMVAGSERAEAQSSQIREMESVPGKMNPEMSTGDPEGEGMQSLIREYMAAMEAELDSSAMGQSFEKTRESISEKEMEQLRTKGPLDQNEQAAQVWLGGGTDEALKPLEEDEEGCSRPVDVDVNLVKHLLESSASQGGLSGPATNILHSMGLTFPSMPPPSVSKGAKNKPPDVEDSQV